MDSAYWYCLCRKVEIHAVCSSNDTFPPKVWLNIYSSFFQESSWCSAPPSPLHACTTCCGLSPTFCSQLPFGAAKYKKRNLGLSPNFGSIRVNCGFLPLRIQAEHADTSQADSHSISLYDFILIGGKFYSATINTSNYLVQKFCSENKSPTYKQSICWFVEFVRVCSVQDRDLLPSAQVTARQYLFMSSLD